MNLIQTIGIGNIITIVSFIIGFIVGYTKLNQKTKANTQDIEQMQQNCIKCKDAQKQTQKDMNDRIEKRFERLSTQIAEIKSEVKQIAVELGKLTGIISAYLRKE